jgi:hypothetical protein
MPDEAADLSGLPAEQLPIITTAYYEFSKLESNLIRRPYCFFIKYLLKIDQRFICRNLQTLYTCCAENKA